MFVWKDKNIQFLKMYLHRVNDWMVADEIDARLVNHLTVVRLLNDVVNANWKIK